MEIRDVSGMVGLLLVLLWELKARDIDRIPTREATMMKTIDESTTPLWDTLGH
jgi:hypothetical protein